MQKKLDHRERKPTDGETDGEAFYRRWSRRKQADREQNLQGPPEAIADPEQPQPQKSDADMLPIESLGEDSEYGEFLSPNVSDKLRKLALRKLFNLPQFALRDGLDDYDEDYTTFEVLGDVLTADRRHQMEMEAERNKQEASQIAAVDAEQTETEAPAAKDEEEDPPDQQAVAPANSTVQDNKHLSLDHNEDESDPST